MNALRTCAAAALVLSLSLPGCQSTPKPPWPQPSGVQSMEANGYPIAYVERGSGPALVLVHGALNDYRTWALQMEALSEHFRVIAVSLRHYYPEPWKGTGEFSLQQHARDLVAFIENLGAGPVHVVGWSRGGYVAAEAAAARPELVRKLALLDPAVFSLLSNSAAASSEDPRAKRARATDVYFKRGDMEGGLQYFFDDVNGNGAWGRLPEGQRQLRRDNAWTIVGQLGDKEVLGCSDFRRLTMPVLLMGGEQSPPAFNQMRAAAQQCLPRARSVTVPKANHQMHQTNAAGVNAELIQFFSEN